MQDETPMTIHSHVKMNHISGFAGGHAPKQGLETHSGLEEGVPHNLPDVCLFHHSLQTYPDQLGPSTEKVMLDGGVTIRTACPQSPLPSQISRVYQ